MALRFAFVLLLSVYTVKLGMAISVLPVDKCGPNAEFQECGSACVPDCANPKPAEMCTLQCVIGCFCKQGYLKNANGECVRPQECDARLHKIPMQLPQAAPQCTATEEFQSCGTACPATCANPHPSPVCTKNCVIGCFCKAGYLRNGHGICVETRECETSQSNMLFAYPPAVSQCKDNEMFMPCGSACAPTCANPHPSPVCTKQCIVGCFCKPGYLKNERGVCVEATTCGARPEEAIAMPPQLCGDNEEYRQCKGCDGTCTNPNPMCPRICIPGCACKQGHLRAGGKCVETRDCPQVQQQSVEAIAMPPQSCGDNEEYRQCKGCDGTCTNPNPLCPRICKPGCACKQGYLRSSGKCVETRECPQVQQQSFMMLPPVPKCQANEEFHPCGTACPATCANPHPSPVCTKNCIIGCFCKEGYFKNAQGECVTAANCDAPATMILAETSVKSTEGKCPTDREIYTDCGNQLDCMASCGAPIPFLVHGYPQVPAKCLERSCTPGCVCMRPYVRHPSGRCVERSECEHRNPFATTQ